MKLQIKDLKIKSFITQVDEKNSKTVLGGAKFPTQYNDSICPSCGIGCTIDIRCQITGTTK